MTSEHWQFRTLLLFVLGVSVALLVRSDSVANPEWAHRWEHIHYSASAEEVGIDLGCVVTQRETGLGVQVVLFGSDEVRQHTITVQLVTESGTMFFPAEGNPLHSAGGVRKGNSDHGQWMFLSEFEWPGNDTDAAWIDFTGIP